MVESRISEGQLDDQIWLIRDLPPDVDIDDQDGCCGAKFHELWTTDVEYEWPRLLAWYPESDPKTRATINLVFVRLIGYTLPSLIDLAHGRTEEDLP